MTFGIDRQNSKIPKVNVPGIKVIYPVNELIKYLLDETSFGHVTKCQVQQT